MLLKITMLLDFLICGSRLFHSFIIEGKEFFKKSCFVQSWGIFSEFREKCLVFGEGTSRERYIDDWLLIILNKQQSFLCQHPCWRDSKPNSWYSFSLEVSLAAPVIANVALHWIDSIFWWNEVLYAHHKLCLHNQEEVV